MGNREDVGAWLRAIRQHAEDEDDRSIASAVKRTGYGGGKAISDSFWSQVEKGKSLPSPVQLLRMARAVDAAPEDIRQLFELAGYGELFHYLVGLGLQAASRHTLVSNAETGILTDHRLPRRKRDELLEHLQDILLAEEARRTQAQQAAAAAEETETG